MDSNVEQSVPFFGVSNIEESVRFYVDGLGFEITRQWTPQGKLRWCWLQLGGAALMLQQFPVEGTRGAGVSVCFQCKDALAIYQAIKTRGIQPKRPFVGNNMWVVSVKDPDGYNLDFQSPTDAPEETEYSEA